MADPKNIYDIQYNDIDIIMGTLIIEWQFATINSRVSTIYGSVINNHADLIMHAEANAGKCSN